MNMIKKGDRTFYMNESKWDLLYQFVFKYQKDYKFGIIKQFWKMKGYNNKKDKRVLRNINTMKRKVVKKELKKQATITDHNLTSKKAQLNEKSDSSVSLSHSSSLKT